MQAYIINNGSFYTEQLEELLSEYKTSVFDFDEINPSDITPGSIVVLSGGHILKVQWHDKQYAKEIEIIKYHDGPVIGICLGAQLIAHVYGEHLHTLEKQRKGTVKINSTDLSNPLFTGKKEMKVYENHHLAIQKLHPPLIGLAESDDGIEIFRHVDKPIYGIQFHPEVLDGNNGAQLFQAILNSVSVRQ